MSKREFNELTEEEKSKVKIHFEQLMNDKNQDCHKLHKNIEDFWEAHKEADYPNWKQIGVNNMKTIDKLADAFYDEDYDTIEKITGKRPKDQVEAEQIIEDFKR